jgi:DNA (cytosine-5)-methyltransferase 1
MRYLSVCSGIEAATVAWHPLGWTPAAFSEIEAFPRAVLTHHYPSVPLHGDFTTIEDNEYGPVDLLVGGTPCQDFSVAGLRAGIAGDRGNLTLEFLRLASRTQPRWIVWENVPGVLSSDGGRALGAFLGGLAKLGYGFAYRVLDAQYFGVAQRRARVFVVGYLGDWRRAAAVLFERESLLGNPAPRREAGKGVAPTISARPSGGGGLGTDFDCDGGLITHALRAEGFDASEDGTGRGTPLVPVAFSIMPMNSGKDYKARETDIAQPIMAGGPVGGNQGGDFIVDPVPFDTTQITAPANYSKPKAGDPCHPLAAGAHAPAIAFGWQNSARQGASASASVTPTLDKSKTPAIACNGVRRLTPRECERLQGFPDDYTLVPYRNKLASDGPRYKALGNSMAVPVMRWIGERIGMVESVTERAAA